mmetsp:Transcript_44646/g.78505  ORF Transcript_44646/g.78505 Transcript_44646/m.78505 type:complete len:1022 (+) Transcript_44646:94-3159(+)
MSRAALLWLFLQAHSAAACNMGGDDSGGCTSAGGLTCPNAVCHASTQSCRQWVKTFCQGCFRGPPGCPGGYSSQASWGNNFALASGKPGASCSVACCTRMCERYHYKDCPAVGCCNDFDCGANHKLRGNHNSIEGEASQERCCVAKAGCSGGAGHGEVQQQDMYETSSVNAPATCKRERQSRTCNDGAWGSWDGSYTQDACKVQARCSSPDAAHGGEESRDKYEAASVNAPATCQSESQTRTCNDGSWSGWSGSYSQSECKVKARCSNPDVVNGGSDSRELYEAAIVTYPAVCRSQMQSRPCNDGTFGSWSGSYAFMTCEVRCPSGDSEDRTRYQVATVNSPAACVSETQTRTCGSDERWTAWSGSYTATTCKVQARCSNPDSVHGGSLSRELYQAATVINPAVCQSEVQSRTCNDGTWSIWSGSFSSANCTVLCATGDTQVQERYENATVMAPASCESELQTKLCTNAVWSGWSGSYGFTSCVVLARVVGEMSTDFEGFVIDAAFVQNVKMKEAIKNALATELGVPTQEISVSQKVGTARRLSRLGVPARETSASQKVGTGQGSGARRLSSLMKTAFVITKTGQSAQQVLASARTVSGQVNGMNLVNFEGVLAQKLREQGLNAIADKIDVKSISASVQGDTPEAPPSDNDDGDSGGGSGAIIGIVVGIVVAGCCLGVICYLCKKRSRVQPWDDDKSSSSNGSLDLEDEKKKKKTDTGGSGTGTGGTGGSGTGGSGTGTNGHDNGNSSNQYNVSPVPHPDDKASPTTFEKSTYYRLYQNCKVKTDLLSACNLLHDFIEEVGRKHECAQAEIDVYMKEIETQITKGPLKPEEIAVILWTSASRLNEMELCSHINAAVRADLSPLIHAVVPVCRLLNSTVVTHRRRDQENPWSHGHKTYRGLGMPSKHFDFFEIGKVYRAPMYLASSFDREVALSFMRSNSGAGNCPVIITIHFDADLGCSHAHYLEKVSACENEKEILMPPYSGFKVLKTNFNKNGMSEIELQAFHDNLLEILEHVELAPWH